MDGRKVIDKSILPIVNLAEVGLPGAGGVALDIPITAGAGVGFDLDDTGDVDCRDGAGNFFQCDICGSFAPRMEGARGWPEKYHPGDKHHANDHCKWSDSGLGGIPA
jgi:hypothetical protein